MPPWACSKKPRLRRLRAGERAALVAEELALDELARDRRAVHLDEGRALRAARAGGSRGDELLAGAALAGDEHARLRRRDLLDLLEEPLHRRALPDHLVARARARRRGRATSRASSRRVEHVLDADEHALAVERLLEEVARAELDGLHRVVDRRVTADHDDRQLARRLVAGGCARAPRGRSCRAASRRRSRGRPGAAGVREDLERLLGGLGLDDLRSPRPRARARACGGCSSRRRRRGRWARRREVYRARRRTPRAAGGGATATWTGRTSLRERCGLQEALARRA